MPGDASFGRFVRTRRRGLDLTQEDLARKVGYSVITIRKVESDERRPSRQLVERLADSLQIAPDEQPAFAGLARAEPGTVEARLLAPAVRDRLPALPPWPSADPPPANPPPTNLPSPLTRLIGREQEVESAGRALLRSEVRLVTMVGPPGIGKSRLGVEAAASVRGAFPDGIFHVPLASVSDAALVPPTIAKILGVKDPAGQPLVAALIEHLLGQRLLLVLDNFEHLLDASPLVAEMLTSGTGPKILATSRAPLRIRGERLFPVPPLATPARSSRLSAADAGRYAAVELFLERAQAVEPEFALTDANAADVAAICVQLDGIPLAIELVAARTRLMNPQSLVARLGDRLALLTDGPRDLPAHQQTLRSAIDWSYDLLDPGEQMLFARLAVFIGGCALPCAEEVVNADGDLPLSVLDGLAALADKNLLGHEERVDGQRYFVFLETIREYALERLAERGEEDQLRGRYARYYLRLAERATVALGGDEQPMWLDRIDAAQANLRAALDWYVHRGDAEPGLRLIAALWTFWHIRSHQAEGRQWITHVLALPCARNDPFRAQALFGAGWIALDQSDRPQANAYFQECLGIFRALHDRPGVAKALHGVGIVAQADGDDREAMALFTESLQLYRDIEDDEGIAWSLDHLGNAALGLDDNERAQRLFSESVAIFRRLRHTWGTAIALHHQGLAAMAAGDPRRAHESFHEAMALFTELANGWGIAISLDHLGYVALSLREHRRAGDYFTQSMRASYADDDLDGVARSLAGLAGVAVAERDLVRAAYLFGGAEALAEASGIRMDPVARDAYRRNVGVVRDRLDEEPIARAWHGGRGMTMSQLVAMARNRRLPDSG